MSENTQDRKSIFRKRKEQEKKDATQAQSKAYNQEIQLATDLPTKEGYTFVEWNTQANGLGRSFAFNQVYADNANLTLYAIWEPTTYQITYYSNEEETTILPQVKDYNHGISLSAEIPLRTGYVFLKWNTQKDGLGKDYEPEEYYTENRDLSLYAQWEIDSYEVRYEATDAQNIPASQTKVYGHAITLSEDIPQKEGFEFLEWNTFANGTGKSYSAGASFEEERSTTLFAQWKIKNWMVSYISNGGPASPYNQIKIFNEPLTISPEIPTHDRLKFIEWNSSKDGTGKAYQPKEMYTLNQDLTLYAQWESESWTMVYYSNDGSNTVFERQTKLFSEPTQIVDAIPQREGYSFAHWNTEKDGKGTTYLPQQEYRTEASLVLYAQWQIHAWKVAYHVNEGLYGPEDQIKLYNVPLVLYMTEPKRENHQFKGWKTSYDEWGVSYKNGDLYEKNEPLNLYARWEQESQDIFLDVNGGDHSMIPLIKINNQDFVFDFEDPVKDGFVFTEWNTKRDGSGASYKLGDVYNKNESITFYAQWSENVFTVTYHTNNNGAATASHQKTSIWEKIAEDEVFEIGFKMGHDAKTIEGWQKKRILQSLLVFILFLIFSLFVSKWLVLVGAVGAVAFYFMKISSLRKAYANHNFLKQIEFYKFFRLLIPYLYQSVQNNTGIFSIFTQMHSKMEENAFKKSFSEFIADITYNPAKIEPYLRFAEDVSGTDRASLMMATVFDFQNSSPDVTVIQELSKTASEELFEGIEEIIIFKSRKFYLYPTYIVMSCLMPMLGFLIAYGYDVISNIQF